MEDKINREVEDYHDDFTDPLLVNEILNGIDDLDNENEKDSLALEEANKQPLDPLERIDQEEKEISKNKEYSDLENKFVLSNNIAAMNLQKFNNIIYDPNMAISDKLYNYYDKGGMSNTPLGSNFGIPRCIAVHF